MSKMHSEDPWTIIASYFRGQHLSRLVRHHIESYNYFIKEQMQGTIDMFNPVHIHSPHDYDPISNKYALEITITFSNFNMYRPQIYEK